MPERPEQHELVEIEAARYTRPGTDRVVFIADGKCDCGHRSQGRGGDIYIALADLMAQHRAHQHPINDHHSPKAYTLPSEPLDVWRQPMVRMGKGDLGGSIWHHEAFADD